MKCKILFIMMINSMLLLSFAETAAQTKERSQIEDSDKWNLADLYVDLEAWKQDKKALQPSIEKLSSYKGKLSESAETLYECLSLMSETYKKYYRLSGYASKLSDQDTRESSPQALKQEIRQVGTELSSATSFITPEILKMEPEKIRDFMNENKELKLYSQFIDDIQRTKEHTLSPEEEKIIAKAGLISGTASDVFGIFKNADMPRPEVEIEGETIRLDDAAYSRFRAHTDRNVRKKVMTEFFGQYKEFERTFGTQLYGQIKRDMFYKNVRNYESCLESALDANNIPTSVYTSLVENVNDNLGTLHKYLELRKRMLGVDTLEYFDIYPPLVKEVDLEFSVDEAKKLILTGLQPLGQEYTGIVNMAFENRWIDMYPNVGKRSGAYSSGSAYDVHPYILMNYNGKYTDVSTLAHELGHTMHSYFSNENQEFINASYPIFLAEVASITNEILLVDYMLEKTEDPEERLAILGDQLESFRGTLFRQTQFAEFELKVHEEAEQGNALTGERFTEIYLDIVRKYYGHDKGIMNINEQFGIEWAYIPHFYYNFYVFQYATSMCAAIAVAEKIKEEGPEMRDKYLNNFLSVGGSDYAIPILKSIGVDMTSSEPFDLAMKKMNEVMNEINELLEQKNMSMK